MPLASSTLLAPHFTAAELGADEDAADDAIVAHLSVVATWLEAARNALGVPLDVTSGFRDPAHNAAVGGVADSEHLTGYAADFVPVGLGKLETFQRLEAAQAAGQLPPFDELIYYVGDNHLHVGVDPRARGRIQYEIVEGGIKRYEVLTAAKAQALWGALPGAPSAGAGRGACAH